MDKQSQVMDYLEERLTSIQVAQGYDTDIGNYVSEWENDPMDLNVQAMRLDYREDELQRERRSVGEDIVTLKTVLRIITSGTTALDDLRAAISDVTKAIGNDLSFGGLVEDIVISDPSKIDKKHLADTAAGSEITIDITWTTDPFEVEE